MTDFSSQMTVMITAVNDKVHRAIQIVHYVGPCATLAYYLVATSVGVCFLQYLKTSRVSPVKTLLGLMSLIWISFVVQAGMLILDTLVNSGRFSSTDGNVGTLKTLCLSIFSLIQCLRSIHFRMS